MSEKVGGGSESGRALHPVVVAEVRSRFAAPDSAQALLAIDSVPLLDSTSRLEIARLQMAAIKLSDGSLDQLREALAVARTDWRDLLTAAGLADADWQQVLRDKGFGVPVAEEEGGDAGSCGRKPIQLIEFHDATIEALSLSREGLQLDMKFFVYFRESASRSAIHFGFGRLLFEEVSAVGIQGTLLEQTVSDDCLREESTGRVIDDYQEVLTTLTDVSFRLSLSRGILIKPYQHVVHQSSLDVRAGKCGLEVIRIGPLFEYYDD